MILAASVFSVGNKVWCI